MDDRTFAKKELSLLYSANDSMDRSELVFHMYSLLESKCIKFENCCTELISVDPVKNRNRFMDIVYGLYLYLHPNTATTTRCLTSDNSPNIGMASQASRMIEKRFTNKFSESYLQNSATLIKTVFSVLDPLFNGETKETVEIEEKEVLETVCLSNSVDLKTLYWVVKTEKFKLDNELTYYDNPFQIFDGQIPAMFQTLEEHQIESYADALNLVKRLKSFLIEIHHTIQFMEKQRSLKGVELPKIVAQQSYDMIQGILKIDVDKQEFIVKLLERIKSLNIDTDIYTLALEFTRDNVYRSLHNMAEWINEFFLEEDDVPMVTTSSQTEINKSEYSEYSVCCDRSKGQEYYKYCLRFHNTTNLSAEQIHELGLKEVSRLSDKLLENVKLINNDINTFEEAVEYIRALSNDPNNIYPDTAEGELEALNDVKSIDAKIKQSLVNLFQLESLPKTECEYKFCPEHQKDSAPAGYYYPPSFDGKNKGKFYMNLGSKLLKFGMPTLVAHEAIPGHHLQLSTVAESKTMHPLLKIEFYNGFNAYVEGWALYTEKLGLEIGLYDTPLIMIGHLMDEMLRSIRLVIDTGLHHYCWSRQKALDYMNRYCPFPLKNNEIEIDRYIGWPGQATSYKIGQLKILELRENRMTRDGFNMQKFNTSLIASGAVPIDLIDELI